MAEYEEMGKTDEYWRELATRNRQRMGILEGMLKWAGSTSDPERVNDIQRVQHDGLDNVLHPLGTAPI